MPAVCRRRAALRAAIALGLPLGCLASAAPAAPVAEPGRPAFAPVPPPPPAATRTGKERMGGKAMDEGRVDDCKVPPERRTRPRPDACPGESGR